MSAGIDVQGSLAKDETAAIAVYGHERIAAVLAAAGRHLSDTDTVTEALASAVAREESAVMLEVWDTHGARVLARVMEDMRNGDDPSGRKAAEALRSLATATTACPHCDGTGEVPA